MKKLVLLLLFIPLISFSQDLFFMGGESFSSTESIVLKSETYGENLTVLFAEDFDSKYIVVQRESILNYKFSGKLNIYFKSGQVKTLLEPSATDYVNKTSTGMFVLQWEDIYVLGNRNIHSIEYSLKRFDSTEKFSAKNIDFESTQLLKQIKGFYSETKSLDDY